MRRQIFVIRMWSESPDTGGPAWRATLVDPSTGADQHFATVEDLCRHLLGMTEETRPDSD